MIDVLEYSDLAKKWANKYSPNAYETFEDLYQTAMIGVIRAAKLYDETKKACFITFANYYIRAEIQRLLYKDTNKKTPRIREDYQEDEILEMYNVSEFDEAQSFLYCKEYIKRLPLSEKNTQFFTDMVEEGVTEAVRLFLQRHKVTKQAAYSRKKKILKIAQHHYERLTGERRR